MKELFVPKNNLKQYIYLSKNLNILEQQQNIEDPFDKLIRSFNNSFPLNEKEEEEVKRLFKKRVVKRRGFLLQEGEVCKQVSFVVSGCFKMYAVDTNFKEHNLQFAIENEWISDIQSFYDEKPSKLYIEAVEASVVLQINHEDLLYLYINYHKFDRNFRIINERKFINFQDRILQSISFTAEERYLNFQRDFPELIKRLPNTQIASYLGITPEFLSKVRKNIVTKK
ncbi:CRP-like cAMP-binding protein [Chryseobacterium ginsenosidimutans]|uniref:Crp/Fnr family transcriptional regulator n=1 Tax=Chryseobacterium ginsenosidimutans TaxID=687846 RepID=UPI00216787B6|nr:Crp/Fnr family transcriptional regulator [Chryseobacterium ginsenosidimutans]MCS3869227.1 CRP-like cAMP-binding protein [Chryseobacterium ginsenosidimutans]